MNKATRLPGTFFTELVESLRTLLPAGWKTLLRTGGSVVAMLGLVFGAIVLLWPHDPALVQTWASPQDPFWLNIARRVSFWGDYPTGILLGAGLLWLAGYLWEKRSWRRIAFALLLGSALAGINANLISFSTGRPRPSEQMTDGFYGFQTKLKYRSFPSGHTATGFGAATVLALACPPAAVPAFATATAIAWSRLYLHRHYVTDLLLGATLGLIWGGAMGLAYRRSTET